MQVLFKMQITADTKTSYAHALLPTRYTRPLEEEKALAYMYIRYQIL